MIDFHSWLFNVPGYYFVPLFEVNEDFMVNTKLLGKKEKRTLVRNQEMENAVINLVESNIERSDWEGLLYIMGKGEKESFVPLYIGKAEKKGVKHPISVNIANIRTNKAKFARWGDNVAYHIGDLSHALFGFESYKKPDKKYKAWANVLFSKYDPPILKEPVYLYLLPWYEGNKGISGLHSSLPALEKELISLASVFYKDSLLNVDGV
ncbi:hypothetical protein ACSU64_04575 [Bacillaceae bacterium C204]|uniref:hypothetical protein n=1 Tax=Neobacillus sp. 204 TaxID=3383351 RepID=UPI00397C12C4